LIPPRTTTLTHKKEGKKQGKEFSINNTNPEKGLLKRKEPEIVF
jgi:hypothetical protein